MTTLHKYECGNLFSWIYSNVLVDGEIWSATWQNQQNECAPSEDSDQQPGHQPSLIRVFAVRMKKSWVLSYPVSAHRRLWSGWADAKVDLSLRWEYSHFVGFVMSQLTCCITILTFEVNTGSHKRDCVITIKLNVQSRRTFYFKNIKQTSRYK